MTYDTRRNKKRDKKWKGRNQKKDAHYHDKDLDDEELLRIQGLCRCKICDSVFSLEDLKCPFCAITHNS